VITTTGIFLGRETTLVSKISSPLPSGNCRSRQSALTDWHSSASRVARAVETKFVSNPLCCKHREMLLASDVLSSAIKMVTHPSTVGVAREIIASISVPVLIFFRRRRFQVVPLQSTEQTWSFHQKYLGKWRIALPDNTLTIC
jgi:hypothetical protein